MPGVITPLANNKSIYLPCLSVSSSESSDLTLDVNIGMRYYAVMIKTFRDKETEKIFNRLVSTKLPQDIQHVARRKLVILDSATELNALRVPPGNRLESLKGSRKGQHSIRIKDQWRICFKWKAGDAYDVEIIDYH